MKPLKLEFEDTRFGNERVEVELGRYGGGNLAISLFSPNEGPWATCTVNLDYPGAAGAIPPEGCVFIKDYSENEGMSKLLFENGILASLTPAIRVPTGHAVVCAYPLAPAFLAHVEAHFSRNNERAEAAFSPN